MPPSGELRRELGVASAVMLGLGSILGTGVFVCVGLVAGIAGPWVMAAVALAAVLATCNALSSAQLAAAYPRSGGTYEYGYELLHPLAGFTAGWMFLCAKSASAATAALGFGGYFTNLLGVSAAGATVGFGCGAVLVLTILVAGGLRRSNITNTLIVSFTLLALLSFAGAGLLPALEGWRDGTASAAPPSWPGFLESVALMFVAYTGYGRVATLGEEVTEPRRTIPRAIVTTLIVSSLIYLVVAAVGVGAVGTEAFYQATETESAPLEVVAREFGVPGIPGLVAAGAVTAMLGVLLNLLLGLSRVLLAMGRRGDMPGAVTRINEQRSTPYVAVIVVGVLILALTATGSIKTTWSFSAFTVLIYYSLTNLAALRLAPEHRLYPRFWSVGGLAICVLLAFWVEPKIWLTGLGLIAVGAVWHWLARRRSARTPRGAS